jgi:dienelactone hydrolase
MTTRRTALVVSVILASCIVPQAFSADVRLGPPKDLDGYFPFEPPASREAWEKRAGAVRRRVLVSQGLWPPPTKNVLEPVIHGTVERDGYTVSKVYFESLPGFFVTGNLYRPVGTKGKLPGVLFAHGHWKDARLSDQPPDAVRHEIATGAERFEDGGRSRFQSLCVQLARMGCVVWQWDMLGDSDSQQLSRELVHGFAKQRPEMNRAVGWGLYSPRAESRLQSVMGLQTWNAIRSLDFLLSLPEVDPERVAMTGSSGGGTQTMLLAAVDDRLKLSFPVVMVSTAMQGGCTCENASLLRIGTGNVEFAALFAPKPQGMNTANDWTRELATKGFPQLQRLYELVGAKDNVMLHRGEHFPHNYNAVTRSAFYTFLNREFRLGFEEPVIERDYEPLSREELSVWNPSHPAPPVADPEFERALLSRLAADIDTQVKRQAATPEGLREWVAPAVETVIGRSYEEAGDSEWRQDEKAGVEGAVRMTGALVNRTHDEEVPLEWLHPEKWSGRVVVWVDRDAPLVDAEGRSPAPVRELLAAGSTVVAPRLFHWKIGAEQPVVANPREFAGYTYGYNHPAACRSVHDLLSLVRFLRTAKVGSHPTPTEVAVAGFGDAAPVVLAARAVAGRSIDRAAAATGGFRFAAIDDYRHPLFIPGAVRYLDLPGLIALNAPHPLWLAGEDRDAVLLQGGYPAAGPERLVFARRDEADVRGSAARWIVDPGLADSAR